jgi:hypothetical protein
VGWTLHSILAEVLLCIGVAMELTISCRPWGTYYQRCPVAASTTVATLSGAEAAVVDVGVAGALALRVHTLVGEGFLLLTRSSACVALSCSICCYITRYLVAIAFRLVMCSCMRRRHLFSWRRCASSSLMTTSISSSESCCKSS